jgi:hypothetical protein
MTIEALERLPLPRIYHALLGGEADPDTVLALVGERAHLVSRILAVPAGLRPDLEIVEGLAQLYPAEHPDAGKDPATDTADREAVRVAIDVLESEMARRRAGLAREGAPTRAELAARLIAFGAEPANDDPPAAEQVLDAIRGAELDARPGAGRVAAAAARLAAGGDWMPGALLLEVLSEPEGFAGLRADPDPVTRAAALLAKRLLWGATRVDGDRAAGDRPIDLDARESALLVLSADEARIEWARRGIPEAELARYLLPPRREEEGRPTPHPRVVPTQVARATTESMGAFPYPMVYPIEPTERARAARYIWSQGVPADPRSLGAVVLFPTPADLRVRWGGPLHPLGVLCAAAVERNQVLSVGRVGGDRDDAEFERLSVQARMEATSSDGFQDAFRSLLLARGYIAVARYDAPHDGRSEHPHAVLVLDPDAVLVLRESVPPFLPAPPPS